MKKNTKKLAKLFTRIIRWSNEDNCYIGSLPEIAPNCCHGDTIAAVSSQLDDIAEISLANCTACGIPYDPPGSSLIIINGTEKDTSSAQLVISLRRSLGLNQRDFAAALGISQSTLSKWETGARRPDAAAYKLLRILRQEPDLITA